MEKTRDIWHVNHRNKMWWERRKIIFFHALILWLFLVIQVNLDLELFDEAWLNFFNSFDRVFYNQKGLKMTRRFLEN